MPIGDDWRVASASRRRFATRLRGGVGAAFGHAVLHAGAGEGERRAPAARNQRRGSGDTAGTRRSMAPRTRQIAGSLDGAAVGRRWAGEAAVATIIAGSQAATRSPERGQREITCGIGRVESYCSEVQSRAAPPISRTRIRFGKSFLLPICDSFGSPLLRPLAPIAIGRIELEPEPRLQTKPKPAPRTRSKL